MSDGLHPNYHYHCSPLPQFEDSHLPEFTSQLNFFPITEMDFELHRAPDEPLLQLNRAKSDSFAELPVLENGFIHPTFFGPLPEPPSSEEDFDAFSSKHSISEDANRKKVIFKAKQKIKPPVINKIQFKGCGCHTSNCLRRYCKCFNSRGYCGEGCGCVDCFNTPEYEKERQIVIEKTKEICKNSFLPKIVTTSDGTLINAEGCRCKSGCSSKHCLCAKNGVGCSPICRCTSCANEKVDLEPAEVKRYFRTPTRIKDKIVIKVSPKIEPDEAIKLTPVTTDEPKKTVILFARPETETRISSCSVDESQINPNIST